MASASHRQQDKAIEKCKNDISHCIDGVAILIVIFWIGDWKVLMVFSHPVSTKPVAWDEHVVKVICTPHIISSMT